VTTLTAPTREHLLETAISALVELSLRERAGADGTAYYNATVQPAIDAAHKAGWTVTDIHGGADRRYGQWLIDNAGT
jgi:hypothetical protein